MNRKQVVFLAGNRKEELYGLTFFIAASCEFGVHLFQTISLMVKVV